MKNAKFIVLTHLLFMSICVSSISHGKDVTAMSQQELNKLGQSDFQTQTKDFKTDNSNLSSIFPDYDKNISSNYDGMNTNSQQSSILKMKCLSFTEQQIEAMYRSSDLAIKQEAVQCDSIRSTEKTNDKMIGNYSDPKQNTLVQMFTERQNQEIAKSSTGNLSISCTPLGGYAAPNSSEHSCTIQKEVVLRKCVQQLSVICTPLPMGSCAGNVDEFPAQQILSKPYSSKTHDENISQRASAKFIDYTNQSIYNTNTNSGATTLKNTVLLNSKFMYMTILNLNIPVKRSDMRTTYTFTYDPEIHGTAFIRKAFSIKGKYGSHLNIEVYINGTKVNIPLNSNKQYDDSAGNSMLGSQYFKSGQNEIIIKALRNGEWEPQTDYFLYIGFKNTKCTVCKDQWNEVCADIDSTENHL